MIGLVRNRIFVKYILVTIIIGGALNALVLLSYFERKREGQTNQVAAEIATLASKISGPASELVLAGETRQARTLMAVFSGFRFVLRASQDGRLVAIVNLGPTRADDRVAVKITGPLGQVLPELARRMGA